MSKIITIGKPGQKGSKRVTVINGNDLNKAEIKLAGQKPTYPWLAFGSLPKNEARRLRKALRANGFPALAAIKRAS